ncbi:hypothetical protein J6253_04895 [bacterium]|nr:hypothetical protein [bacterium]MBP5202058.1 hypothetical protein [bacterium]
MSFKEKLFFAFAIFGLSISFVLLAQFHSNPFRVPTFSDIPVCYIYGNAYIAIILSALLKKSFLTRLLASAGFTVGLLVSAYFLFVWVKFAGRANIFPAEIFGIKTIYTDFFLFVILLVLRILKKP